MTVGRQSRSAILSSLTFDPNLDSGGLMAYAL